MRARFFLALLVLSTDETGIAVVSGVTDLRSADYPIVAWRADDLAADADVRMLWRTDVAPAKVNSINLGVAGGGLAPAVVEELFEAFDKLRQEVAILIVDHHLDLALALSDRTVALERGAVTHVGPSAALSNDLELRRKVLWL